MSEICKLKLYIVGDKKILLCPHYYYDLIKSDYELTNNILDYKAGIGAEGILIPLGPSESKTAYEYTTMESSYENKIAREYYDALAAVCYSCLYELYDKKINNKIKTRMVSSDKIQEYTADCNVNTEKCEYVVCIASERNIFTASVRFIANMNVELDNLESRLPTEEDYEEGYEYFDSIKPNFGINKYDRKLLSF